MVEDIELDSGCNKIKINGFTDIFALLWNQTWPLFSRKHLSNTLLLFSMAFVLYLIGYGLIMW